MPAVRNLAVLLLLSVLAGCSAFQWLPWVGDDDDDEKKEEELEPVELERFDETVKFDQVWSASIGDGLGKTFVRSRVAVAADRIFAADAYGRVEARDRFTGKRVWKIDLPGDDRGMFDSLNFYDRRDPSWVSGGVGYAHGLVLIGTVHGDVIALSPVDGSETWRANVGAEVLAPPVGGDDLIYVQTEDGRLLALDRTNGSQRWSFDNPVPVLTLRGTSMPVFGNGMVYCGFPDGMVVAIRAGTGEPIWEHRVMLPEGRSELQRMVDIDSTPALSGGLLFVVAYQGRLKALRANDGGLVWEQEVSSFLDLATGFSDVFIVDAGDQVLAYNQQSAERLWSQQGLLRRQLSSPATIAGYVLVGDSEGYLHALSQSDGSFAGRRKIDGDGIRSPVVVADDMIYVLGNSGELKALELEPR
jgi:outer membrane protein assembly factor BamB